MAENPECVEALVTRGVGVDLADKYLEKINAATLFIMGEMIR